MTSNRRFEASTSEALGQALIESEKGLQVSRWQATCRVADLDIHPRLPAPRPNVYKLEKVFDVKKEIRIRSVTLCEVPTIVGLEQT
jgi:hypothetical protein